METPQNLINSLTDTVSSLRADVARLLTERDRLKAALSDADAEVVALADALRHMIYTHDDSAGETEAAIQVQSIIDEARATSQAKRG